MASLATNEASAVGEGGAEAGGGDAESTNIPHILLMGPRRSGKSSIQKVVLYKMSPHETLFLESTNQLDIKYVKNTSFARFQVWDFPGNFNFEDSVNYGGQTLTEEAIFQKCGALIYVIDAQDEPYNDTLQTLHDTVVRAHKANPNIYFEVFIHKVDGDLFLSDEHKVDCQRDIHEQIYGELRDRGLDIQVSFQLTSIYDHSIFHAFSKVVQKLLPQLPVMENLLDVLVATNNFDKAFLFDVVSKTYIATDSNPVDMQSYELCSDMLDAVIDVSCIYGMTEEDSRAFDEKSASVIHLNNGMVLYLREISSYLALVCLLRESNFRKRGLIDFNIEKCRQALNEVYSGKS